MIRIIHIIFISLFISCNGSSSNLQQQTLESDTINSPIDSLAYKYKESGNIKADAGNLQEAIDDYTKAIEIYPQYFAAYYNRAITKSDIGDKQGAIEDYTKAIFLNPKQSKTYHGRATVKSSIGNKQGAIADYTKAIEISPKYTNSLFNRAIVKSDIGDKRGAIIDYTKVITLDPMNSEAYYGRGLEKSELGNEKEAIEDYNKSIEINPQYINAYINRALSKEALGDVNGEIGDYRLGIKMCKDITDKSPFALLFNNLGRTLYDLKRFKESAEAYGEGIKMIPNDYKLYYGRGLARYKTGDEKGACQDWKKSSELGCEEAKNLLPICKDCD